MALKILQAFRLILQYCEAASLRSVVPAAAILAKHKRIERSSRLIKYFIHHWYNNLEIVSGERFLLRGRPQRTCRSKMHKKTVIKTSYTIAAAICKCASQGGETHSEVAISILIPRMEVPLISLYYVKENGVITYI